MNEKVNLLDILLDKDNHDLIAMENEEGVQYVFEQVANVALDVSGEKKLFVVLRHILKTDFGSARLYELVGYVGIVFHRMHR